MGAFIDLSGRHFGNLTVLSRAGKDRTNVTWLCRCSCGNEKVISGASLRKGRSRSCGCNAYNWLKEQKPAETHGASRTQKYGGKERLYRVWCGMRERCNNPNHNRFEHYGGRGITVCADWNDYAVFRTWAFANGYDPNAPRGKCTIDRIDVNGNYCPENCRWVDAKTQRANQRKEV